MQENRRGFFRVRRGFPVEIQRANGEVIEAAATDVSRGGLRLECARETVEMLAPDVLRGSVESTEELTLHLFLPFLSQAPQRVRARGELLHVSQSAIGTYQLGLRFTAFPGDGYEVLESYILEWMRYESA